MKRRDQFKHTFVFLDSVVMLGVQTLFFARMWFDNFQPYMQNPYYGRGNWAAIGLYALLAFFVTRGFGGYDFGNMRVGEAIASNLLSVVIANIIGYVEIALITVHYVPLHFFFLLILEQGIFVILWSIFVRWSFLKLYPPRQMLVVYSAYSPQDMMQKIRTREDRYNVCETISMKEGYEAVTKKICEYQAVLLYDLDAKERNDMLKFCFDRSIRTYITPKVSDIIISGMDNIYMFDSPMYLARNMGLSPVQRAVKRFFDILLSLIAIVVFSPIMLVVAICVKSCDHGPVFYKQTRLTLNGKPFQILKFRSMYVDSEQGKAQLAHKHDDRITPVGRVIRNLHFDELPQLFNILTGDMSIVGPRPERPEIFEKYKETIPEYTFRLKVKAGLTGMAQVHGKYNTLPIDKLKYDLMYVQHYSLAADMKLILQTVKIMFQKETSEGINDSQRTALKDVDDGGVQVSVIMPAHKAEKFLEKAVRSVMAQDVPLELFIIDDHSPDHTGKIADALAKEYPGRIQVFHNETNLGAAKSRDIGIYLAKGRYIAFLDADDWWEEGKLSKQVDVLDNTGAVLCSTARELVNEDGTPMGRVIDVPDVITYRMLLRTNVIACSSVLVRAAAAKEFGMSHEELHEDYILWLQVLKKYGSGIGINEPLIKSRMSQGGKSRDKRKSAKMQMGVYRLMGFGPIRSAFYFLNYAFYGFQKYYGRKGRKK